MPVADIQLVDVVSQHHVEPFARAASFDNQLPHVRNVEDTHLVSHSLIFLHDAGVLHRHQPAGEWDHFRAEPHVLLVKRRFLRRIFSHAPN